jgi:hypothetical protein
MLRVVVRRAGQPVMTGRAYAFPARELGSALARLDSSGLPTAGQETLSLLDTLPRSAFAGLGKPNAIAIGILKRLDEATCFQMTPGDLIESPKVSTLDARTFAAHRQVSFALRRPESLQGLGRGAAPHLGAD